MMSFWDVLCVAPLVTSCSPSFGGGSCGVWVLDAAVLCVCTESWSAAPTAREGGVCSKFIHAKVKCQAATCGFLIKQPFT